VAGWISYTVPGGLAGKAIEKAVLPVIGLAIWHTTGELIKNVESL